MLTGYTIMLLQFTNDHFCGNVFTVYPLGNKDMYRQMNKRTNTLFVMTEKWPWSVGPSLGNMALETCIAHPHSLLSFHTHCQCQVLYATSYYIYAFVTPYGLGCQYTVKMQSLPSPLYTDFTSAGMTLISDQLSLLSSTEQYGILTTYSKPFRHNQPKILIRQNEHDYIYDTSSSTLSINIIHTDITLTALDQVKIWQCRWLEVQLGNNIDLHGVLWHVNVCLCLCLCLCLYLYSYMSITHLQTTDAHTTCN